MDIEIANTVQSSQASTLRQSKSKGKITVSLSRPNKNYNFKKPELHQEVSDHCVDLNGELGKLFDISQRCQAYFDKYVEERYHEIDYTELMFQQLDQFLNNTFKNLIQSIENKKRELKTSIEEKKISFLNIQQQQFQTLSAKLSAVKAIEQQCSAVKKYTEENISLFAVALNEFYEKIEQIEQVNYRDNIRESINFLHRLIQDQSSSGFLHQSDNQKLFDPIESPVSISFNNDQLFMAKEDSSKSQKKWDELKVFTEFSQKNRSDRIQKYNRERFLIF